MAKITLSPQLNKIAMCIAEAYVELYDDSNVLSHDDEARKELRDYTKKEKARALAIFEGNLDSAINDWIREMKSE